MYRPPPGSTRTDPLCPYPPRVLSCWDTTGAAAMHAAFGLRATLLFDLAAGEYHTNVLLSVLAGRALVLCPDGFADPDVGLALRELYPHSMVLEAGERLAFAGNCMALDHDSVWMSARAAARSEEHTSELQSLMRISYAVFCLTKKNNRKNS